MPSPLQPEALQNVRLIATDVDGTLTLQGEFSVHLLGALQRLAEANIPVILVTGRSAGWVNALVEYLPVTGAIAENGGLFYKGKNADPEFLVPIPDLSAHRQQLAEMFGQLQQQFPHLQESTDNRFRLTDWTFEVQGLTVEDLKKMGDRCLANGWSFTYSTVQCHIKPLQQEKALGLMQVLSQHFPDYSVDQVVTVGDSPNDVSLFDGDRFPLSVGVANVLHYLDQLAHAPRYVTRSPEVLGFCELVEYTMKHQ
ncbi:MAG: Cof-type HAD-IIB family hydrolase [Oculatellaceae cyanobacterium Prado106]|jgi:hypothetical protein|nr:Cof-type HAD-IIB family hydrolase [Oculatellaceae cyanobacterium Prado106]